MDIWAKKEDGQFVRVSFSRAAGEADTYTLPNQHEMGFVIFQKKLEQQHAVVDDAQIELSDGTRVYPVIFDHAMIETRRRQTEFTKRDTQGYGM